MQTQGETEKIWQASQLDAGLALWKFQMFYWKMLFFTKVGDKQLVN